MWFLWKRWASLFLFNTYLIFQEFHTSHLLVLIANHYRRLLSHTSKCLNGNIASICNLPPFYCHILPYILLKIVWYICIEEKKFLISMWHFILLLMAKILVEGVIQNKCKASISITKQLLNMPTRLQTFFFVIYELLRKPLWTHSSSPNPLNIISSCARNIMHN